MPVRPCTVENHVNTFSAWVESHGAIVIAAALVGAGVQIYYRLERLRALLRRIAERQNETALQSSRAQSEPSAWRRAIQGASFTLIVPGAFSILIWAAYLFAGRTLGDNGDIQIDTLVLSIAYPLGSALMGAVLGLGRPVMRNFIMSTFVGVVAVAPWIIGIELSMGNALTHWGVPNTAMTVMIVLALGIALGFGATAVRRRRVITREV